jgi:hypothetical protein
MHDRRNMVEEIATTDALDIVRFFKSPWKLWQETGNYSLG